MEPDKERTMNNEKEMSEGKKPLSKTTEAETSVDVRTNHGLEENEGKADETEDANSSTDEAVESEATTENKKENPREEAVAPEPVADEAATSEVADDEDAAPDTTTGESVTPEVEAEGAVPEAVASEAMPDKVATPDATPAAAEDVAAEVPEEQGKKGKEEVVSPGANSEAREENTVQADTGEPKDEKKAEEQEEDAHNEEGHEEDDEHEHEHLDFSHFSKNELLDKFTEVLHWDNLKKADRIVKELKAAHDEIFNHERQEALDKYIAEGGEEESFDFKPDDISYRFEENYKLFRERKQKHYHSLEKQKEDNYKRKNEVLEKLRSLVDGEENTTSINALKKIQEEWKTIGPVPGKFAKTLWANYNALLDRFYDNRSIYFELKELDRKKNLESKLELCEKAEHLAAQENIKDAVKELNLLHEEFKHLGPVPQENQEEIWQRFKSASDQIYSKRREMVDELKTQLKANMILKVQLCEEAEKFASFESDRINDWNKKTKEVLELQKRWEAIGGVPKEHAKKINKRFWGSFKTFFNNKSGFFKQLEGKRHENLKLKEELVAKAEVLKDSEDWETVANELKQLQQQWREVGPVPEKVKEEVFGRFKSACDHFFERKRSQGKGNEKEFYENLKRKEGICEEILKLASNGEPDLSTLQDLQGQYSEIGFVPRNAIKSIQKKYQESLDKLWKSAETLDETYRNKLKMAIQVSKIKSEPHSDRKIYQKESHIRRQIGALENDIAVWKNNVEFLASSKKADKLKADFDEKIARAEEELAALKAQLKVLRQTA